MTYAEHYYKKIFEEAGDAIFVHASDDGRILDANKAAEELTGYPREALLNMAVSDISVHVDQFGLPQVRELIRQAQEQGSASSEWLIQPRDAQPVPVQVHLKLINVENQTQVLALVRDISTIKRFQHKLIERETYFRRLIEHSSDVIAIVQPNGRLSYVSPSLTAVLGYQERFAIGRNVLHVIHKDDCEAIRSLLNESAGHYGQARQIAYRVLHHDGQWRHHEAVCKNLLHDPDINGILVNFRDVTARVKAEDAARERERERDHLARCRTMGELASALAHEINQPLSALNNFIGGSLIRLQKGQLDKQETIEALSAASHQISRVGKIMSSMRGFLRNNGPDYHRVDLNEVVRAVEQLIEIKAQRGACHLNLEYAAQPLWVLADEVLLGQVILNLAFNAMEAMETCTPERRQLTIRIASKGQRAEVTVEDQGPGLQGKNPETLFNAFYSTKENSMGIGLTLSRNIVDSHNGHLWVTEGSPGAIFHLTLPHCLENKNDSGTSHNENPH